MRRQLIDMIMIGKSPEEIIGAATQVSNKYDALMEDDDEEDFRLIAEVAEAVEEVVEVTVDSGEERMATEGEGGGATQEE